jgi:hypothetical protein
MRSQPDHSILIPGRKTGATLSTYLEETGFLHVRWTNLQTSGGEKQGLKYRAQKEEDSYYA